MADIKKAIIPPILLKHLVLRLWKRNKELHQEEESVKEADPLMREESSDRSETAESNAIDVEKTIQEARLNLVQGTLLEVRKALAKVRIGTYGCCEVCKKPIDLARLKAFPQATKCYDCSKKEQ
ncbi:TraR/DksA C4-type zinc finger protein [Patescibacteria group bacterium]|nr:TraR/DksA C4-type zinc finger protein [Patescibacteria group bacterium]